MELNLQGKNLAYKTWSHPITENESYDARCPPKNNMLSGGGGEGGYPKLLHFNCIFFVFVMIEEK